jgi:hypothetical protein
LTFTLGISGFSLAQLGFEGGAFYWDHGAFAKQREAGARA